MCSKQVTFVSQNEGLASSPGAKPQKKLEGDHAPISSNSILKLRLLQIPPVPKHLQWGVSPMRAPPRRIPVVPSQHPAIKLESDTWSTVGSSSLIYLNWIFHQIEAIESFCVVDTHGAQARVTACVGDITALNDIMWSCHLGRVTVLMFHRRLSTLKCLLTQGPLQCIASSPSRYARLQAHFGLINCLM